MDHTYAASTVEMDDSGFNDLKQQILNKNQPAEEVKKTETHAKSKTDEKPASYKKSVFSKGDNSVELDDDYELEFMADKRPTKLTLRELKDRAAGDIAIKNRMHSLAEEKKRVQASFKEFAKIAKEDPIGALEYISEKAKEADSDFEYSKYIEMLADQAEKLGQMDEKERKAWELEKKLNKAQSDLSQKERVEAVALRKQQLLDDYPEIGNQQLGQMVEAVLANEELMQGLETEDDIMDRIEDLIQETLTQRDIITVIEEINPEYVHDNDLIFTLSDQLRLNPDLDEEDVRDIVQEVIGRDTSKQQAVRTLSSKARQSAPMKSLKSQNASAYDLLAQQLQERKKDYFKTPIQLR